ncbi:mannosyltransferase [Winogradskyella sp. DF17]|jgi:hypothetical protein|uniref:Mannosyltransferase n=1 Tax=Winogradskyella pelagia TaxID=2819984 RepID=A0ABS3T0A9_9FLAO|nr:mannosyltransferase [Winogradskyella sp. DF17]MBO3115689.1 mannosyltransferase [Winogradskyella sp. DF17]
MSLWKYHKIPLLYITLSLLFYAIFAYGLERTDSTKLLSLYFALFVLAYQLLKTTGFNFKQLVVVSILFRLIFLFAIPNLSQDFYRFIWDGQMILEGISPYLHLPKTFFEQGEFPIAQGLELYKGMGDLSASNYTNYPPINQLCFVIAGLLSGKSILGSVIVMRLMIIGADIGILYFGKKLLEAFKLPTSRIFWYALNPFIIIELTGNLHFEGLMILFLLWSLYLLHKGKWEWSALLMGCSIATKLIPLMLLPLVFWWFIKKLNLGKLLLFYIIAGVTVVLTYAPFFSMQFITNYSESIGLWFGNFEFNASIYYLAREIGYWITGYNEIAIISKALSVLTFMSVLGLAFFRRNDTSQEIITSMLLALSLYFILSTTVHPWYLASLVLLCVFTKYKFPLVWSVVVVLTYLTYSNIDFKENLWFVGLEYVIVFLAVLYDVLSKKRMPVSQQSSPL